MVENLDIFLNFKLNPSLNLINPHSVKKIKKEKVFYLGSIFRFAG